MDTMPNQKRVRHKVRYSEPLRKWECSCGQSFDKIGNAVAHLPISPRKSYRKRDKPFMRLNPQGPKFGGPV